MCLAVPMKLVELGDNAQSGVADLDGARTRVNLSLIDAPQLGDFLIVHAGFAIERLDEEEANARLEMFEELGEQWREQAAAQASPAGTSPGDATGTAPTTEEQG